jgi:poly(3-hydroxyalkanoate) synthetase
LLADATTPMRVVASHLAPWLHHGLFRFPESRTLRKVFQEYHLPRGKLEYRGRLVKPEAIRLAALFTVGGESDDICSIGQTLAAQDLCSKLAPYRKQHHLQATVGHHGVFIGKRWDRQTYPRLRDFIQAFDEHDAADFSNTTPSLWRNEHHDKRTQGNFDH